NARSAALQGLMAFSTETCYGLRRAEAGEEGQADPDGLVLDMPTLESFCRRHGASNVIVYGFTYVVYLHLGGGLAGSQKPLQALKQAIGSPLLPHSQVLHSGGWKKLEQLSMDKASFNRAISTTLGSTPDAVMDYYGMVEQLG